MAGPQLAVLFNMLVQLLLSVPALLLPSEYLAALLGHCWKQGVVNASSWC